MDQARSEMGLKTVTHNVDFCVVGGGIAGICAAVSAARHGLKVALMQERPMLGGNASSEIRMWICGCGGKNNRETGILEELQLRSLYQNPYKLYPVWDGILYDLVVSEPNITLLLNTSCCAAEMDGSRISSVTGWQMTTQTWQKVYAAQFSDCSGDSILAPLTGAEYRMGRESKYEFNEQISEEEADCKTMGNSCLIQARKLDTPVRFIAPSFAKKLTKEDVANRRPNIENSAENYWYLELGGDRDTIGDAETLRDELIALAYGMWDYIKNSGEFDADLWQLDFIGFLPGKRESRRMVGDYIMPQTAISSDIHFSDTVAYGGWPLDDHDPGGFWHIGHPNKNGYTPKPYCIPLSVLSSKNISNLWFAGRNISMTHAAMSSSRVMATCALLGQAVGTAAYIAGKYGCTPRQAREEHIDEIQQTLMYDDCFLPYIKYRVSDITLGAELLAEEQSDDLSNLRNGIDRNNHTYGEGEQGAFIKLGSFVKYRLNEAEYVESVRIIFDSDLDRLTLPGDDCERTHTMRANVKPDSPVMHMPLTLVKDFRLEIEEESGDITVLDFKDNIKRFTDIGIGRKIRSASLVPVSLWDGKTDGKAHIFSFELR